MNDSVFVKISKKYDVWNGLYRLWQFNGNLNEEIVGSNAYNLTPSTPEKYSTGKIKSGLYFTYNPYTSSIVANETFNFPNWTISFWVRLFNPINASSRSILGSVDPMVASYFTIMRAGNNFPPTPFQEGKIVVYGNYAAMTGENLISNQSVLIVNGGWYHIVVTNNGIFLNGVEIPSTKTNTPFNLVSNSLLAFYYDFLNYGYRDSILEQVCIWNRVLSGGEISALYNGGNGLAYN